MMKGKWNAGRDCEDNENRQSSLRGLVNMSSLRNKES